MKNINGIILEELFIDEKTGKKCIIALSSFGYRVGYVETDKNTTNSIFNDDSIMLKYKISEYIEPITIFSINMYINRAKAKNKHNLYVHGGITFTGALNHLDMDDVTAVGFDCAHYNDAPDLEALGKYFGKKSGEYKMASNLARKNDTRHIWSFEDVKTELVDLASQVSKAESAYKTNIKIDRAKRWRKKERTA